MPLPALGPHHLADPRLWAPLPVQVIEGAESRLGVPYARPLGWRPLTLDLHLPLHSSCPWPVVVYAHGGSFVGGVKEMGPWASLPAHGIAVASIDYRLAGEARHPEPIEDVLAAIRWVRANAGTYGLDAQRIAGWGSSAGGYLMARAAFADDEGPGRPVGDHPDVSASLSAVVLHYPVVDFTALLEDALQRTLAADAGVVDVVSQYFGFLMDDDPQVVAEAAVTGAAAGARRLPPLLLSHGDADTRCGLAQSRRLQEAVVAAGGQARLDVVPGADHAAPVFSTPTVVSPAVEFLCSAWSARLDSVVARAPVLPSSW